MLLNCVYSSTQLLSNYPKQMFQEIWKTVLYFSDIVRR